MDRKEYCDRVLAQVGRLTTDEANDLRNELAGHIEDHAEALVEHGYTEEDAAARAVELMGDPEETGKALREQYRHFWLVIVQRAAVAVTVVACVQAFFLLPMLGMDPATFYVEFNIAEKLQGSFEEQASAMQTATGGPWMTRSEARARMNLPHIEEADGLVVPLNVLVGGQASPTDSGSQNAKA